MKDINGNVADLTLTSGSGPTIGGEVIMTFDDFVNSSQTDFTKIESIKLTFSRTADGPDLAIEGIGTTFVPQAPVPEPASLSLMCLAALALLRARRRCFLS
jgi:hypothetical protein